MGVDDCGNKRADRSNGDLSPYSRLGAPRVRTPSALATAGIEAMANDPAPTKERLVNLAPDALLVRGFIALTRSLFVELRIIRLKKDHSAAIIFFNASSRSTLTQ
jgi:hypothetical protein